MIQELKGVPLDGHKCSKISRFIGFYSVIKMFFSILDNIVKQFFFFTGGGDWGRGLNHQTFLAIAAYTLSASDSFATYCAIQICN